LIKTNLKKCVQNLKRLQMYVLRNIASQKSKFMEMWFFLPGNDQHHNAVKINKNKSEQIELKGIAEEVE